MNQSTKWIVGVIVVAIIVGAYFVSKGPKRAVVSTEPIKIGLIAPLTGDAASYGEPIKNATELAVAEINSSGGIGGRQIEMIYEDGKCSGKDAVSAAQKLINIDQVKIITGLTCSSEVLGIAPLTEQKKVLVFVPGASSPDITNAGDFTFRNNPSDSDGAKATAEVMLKDHKKLAVISEKTDFAQAALRVFLSAVQQGSGTTVVNESFISNTSDFKTALAKIKAANPEALFVNPQTEVAAGTIIKQAREIGLNIPIYGNMLVGGLKAIEVAGPLAEGIVVVDAPGLSDSNQKAVKFLADYTAKYGKPNLEFYMGAAYDDIYILSQVISSVGLDTAKIRDYLYGLKNYNGVIGTYGFDENGDLTGIAFTIKKIQNGKLVETQ